MFCNYLNGRKSSLIRGLDLFNRSFKIQQLFAAKSLKWQKNLRISYGMKAFLFGFAIQKSRTICLIRPFRLFNRNFKSQQLFIAKTLIRSGKKFENFLWDESFFIWICSTYKNLEQFVWRVFFLQSKWKKIKKLNSTLWFALNFLPLTAKPSLAKPGYLLPVIHIHKTTGIGSTQ